MCKRCAWYVWGIFTLLALSASHGLPPDPEPSAAELQRVLADAKPKAEAGDADAQARLADVLRHLGSDYPQALKWYRRAAEQGHPAAQAGLGFMLCNGLGAEKNVREAAEWFRRSAAQGNVWGQCNMGSIMLKGVGITKNPRAALVWFLKAAAQGSAYAEKMLGDAYSKGLGVEKDYTTAATWYRKAATHRDTTVEGFLLPPLFPDLEPTVGPEDAEAHRMLGMAYLHTGEHKKALKHFLTAAREGDLFGCYNVACLYEDGLGVPRSGNEAFRWYQAAARRGVGQAQCNLGRVIVGNSTRKEMIRLGYAWLLLASESDDPEARKKSRGTIDQLASRMEPGEVEKARALAEWLPYAPKKALRKPPVLLSDQRCVPRKLRVPTRTTCA